MKQYLSEMLSSPSSARLWFLPLLDACFAIKVVIYVDTLICIDAHNWVTLPSFRGTTQSDVVVPEGVSFCAGICPVEGALSGKVTTVTPVT